MRVLGIDPGSRAMGYGVVEERAYGLVHLGHGVIRADSSMELAPRLSLLFSELRAAVELFRPDSAAVEGVFACRNLRSALILGHARGVALLVAALSGLEVYEYSPASVKRSVGAGGAAGKDGVARMVSRFLRVHQPIRNDASDALAIAICHANHHRSARRAILPNRSLPTRDPGWPKPKPISTIATGAGGETFSRIGPTVLQK